MKFKTTLLSGVSKGTIIKSKVRYEIGLSDKIKQELDKVNSKLYR